jgi:hypothetical protein
LSEWLGHAVNSMVWGVSCAGVAVDRSSFSPARVRREYSIEIDEYTNRKIKEQ